MIRESSVGVGVKGKEGNAAVNSADYIIREFHHLIKLMFVGLIEKMIFRFMAVIITAGIVTV